MPLRRDRSYLHPTARNRRPVGFRPGVLAVPILEWLYLVVGHSTVTEPEPGSFPLAAQSSRELDRQADGRVRAECKKQTLCHVLGMLPEALSGSSADDIRIG